MLKVVAHGGVLCTPAFWKSQGGTCGAVALQEHALRGGGLEAGVDSGHDAHCTAINI